MCSNNIYKNSNKATLRRKACSTTVSHSNPAALTEDAEQEKAKDDHDEEKEGRAEEHQEHGPVRVSLILFSETIRCG